MAKSEILAEKWDMIILDEINYAVKYGLISLEILLELLEIKPLKLHLMLIGREASQAVIDKADLVTEMVEVKHPYKSGIKAQAGIEY